MHPIEQYIQQLSSRLQRTLNGREQPEEIFHAARQLCGPMHWLASRVSEEVLKRRGIVQRNPG